jgi:hypothetical protein
MQGQSFFRTAWLVLLTGLSALNLAGLWAVGHGLRALSADAPQAVPKQARPEPPALTQLPQSGRFWLLFQVFFGRKWLARLSGV